MLLKLNMKKKKDLIVKKLYFKKISNNFKIATIDGVKQKSNNFDLMHFRCYKLCLQNESK